MPLKSYIRIHQHDFFFVVRAKKNLQLKCTKWRRRLPNNILTDSEIELTDVITMQKYPEKFAWYDTGMKNKTKNLFFCPMLSISYLLKLLNFIKTVGWSNFSSNG